jgi:hypothetical protein
MYVLRKAISATMSFSPSPFSHFSRLFLVAALSLLLVACAQQPVQQVAAATEPADPRRSR